MNTLLSLRQAMKDAEKEYKQAQGSMESPTGLIVAKAALKEARFAYHEALEDAHEEQIAFDNSFDKEVQDWLNMEDVGKEVLE